MSLRNYANHAPQQTLTGSITNASTSLTVASSFAGWPASFPFFAELDRGTASAEIVSVTNIAGLTATIVRAQDGDAAVSHPAGATLDFVVVALDLREANAHVNASAGVHGRSGNIVGDSDVQTLTNKTLTNPTVNGQTLTGTVANTSTHSGNPALKGKSSTVGGKSLSLQDSTGVEKLSVLDNGNLATSGSIAATGAASAASLTVGGSLYGIDPVIRVYTAGATWTKPANLRAVKVRLVGGGGGGGGAAGGTSVRACGGGGGSGGYAEALILAANLLATETVTVGALGAGGLAGANSGSSGNTSSFGAHCSATGGGGGGGMVASTLQNASGGPGGQGTGDVGARGSEGNYGVVLSSGVGIAGNGASSIFGGGGNQRATAGTGSAAGPYGSGGGGAHSTTTSNAGGDGSDGVVIVEEFYF